MARRVAVAFNDDSHLKTHLNPTELLGSAEVLETAEEVAEILGGTLVPVREDIDSVLRDLQRFDVVVDLCEGVLGVPGLEKNFALALEMLGIPHTSCEPVSVGLVSDKILVKKLLRTAGIPTPRGFADPRSVPPGTYIVKPSLEDGGIGIEAASVVRSPEELEARCRHVLETYSQPPLIEEFIDGRELNQSFYCGRLLPPGEMFFAADLKPWERVVGAKAKWDIGSPEDLATVSRMAVDLDEATRREMSRICLAAAGLLGIDMSARFDLRQARDGSLYLIDINPNPDIGPGSGFRKALEAARVPFSEFLDTLIMAAYARCADEDPSSSKQRSRPNP